MRRHFWLPFLVVPALLLSAGIAWLFAQAGASNAKPLASLFPTGPALYLEAKDFQALLKDWNASESKKLWLASDNYEAFSRSNLFLKFQAAQKEFAVAAGIPPDMNLLGSVAGSDSGIAMYDIGNLQFLYVTRMPNARSTAGALWKLRGSYEPRKAAGFDYYYKYDRASSRTAVFAAANGYLLLATREDVLAGSLALLAGQSAPSVAGETWFSKSVQAAKARGDLRLVLNLPLLLRSPYMRSYWIQHNSTDFKQFDAAISDVTRGPADIREDRTLFRPAEETVAWNESAVGQLVRLVPPTAGFYRAIAAPSSEQAFDWLSQKILDPQPGNGAAGHAAPQLPSSDPSGSEADLEIRIDEPPLTNNGAGALPDAVAQLFPAATLQAALYTAASRITPDGVFVGIDSAVVLLRSTDWNSAEVRAALSSAAASLWGIGALGSQWVERRTGAQTVYTLDGLAPVALAVNGPLLIVANRAEMLDAILANLTQPAQPGARYAAAYRNAREFANFKKLTTLLDNPLKTDGPSFFSGNIASFGQSLGRFDSASIQVHDTGSQVSQTVLYRLQP